MSPEAIEDLRLVRERMEAVRRRAQATLDTSALRAEHERMRERVKVAP